MSECKIRTHKSDIRIASDEHRRSVEDVVKAMRETVEVLRPGALTGMEHALLNSVATWACWLEEGI